MMERRRRSAEYRTILSEARQLDKMYLSTGGGGGAAVGGVVVEAEVGCGKVEVGFGRDTRRRHRCTRRRRMMCIMMMGTMGMMGMMEKMGTTRVVCQGRTSGRMNRRVESGESIESG